MLDIVFIRVNPYARDRFEARSTRTAVRSAMGDAWLKEPAGKALQAGVCGVTAGSFEPGYRFDFHAVLDNAKPRRAVVGPGLAALSVIEVGLGAQARPCPLPRGGGGFF